MNLGFVSKRKIAKILNECDKNSGVKDDGSYTVPPSEKEFYFDMGSQSTTNYLRSMLYIKWGIGKWKKNLE